MALEDELFDIERGFWLSGEEHFLQHLDDDCLLAFPQVGEMHGFLAAKSRSHGDDSQQVARLTSE